MTWKVYLIIKEKEILVDECSCVSDLMDQLKQFLYMKHVCNVRLEYKKKSAYNDG